GIVEDKERLQDLLPTIRFLISQKSSTLIAGHIGRPENNNNFDLSTKHLVTILSSSLNMKVIHFSDFFEVRLSPNTLGLFENLRFWDGEEKNDEDFSKKLASLADVYVNESFDASHRLHASIVGVPRFLPHAAGLHFEKEVEVLSRILKNPKHPLVVLIGGAKIETKLPVIKSLAKIADFVLVGGRLPLEKDREKLNAPNIFTASLESSKKDVDSVSINRFIETIEKAKMIVWNGPMGVFEEAESEKGTREIAKIIAESSAEKIVGGGETIWALKKFGLIEKMDWVSSGGGAMLEFLSGKSLPGIIALE
ncbi:phosphoglycerate kinase, partial [Candidatus Woesebacteria bacterium]|nr:phosphoglycerate kinase [Candidatus Woesebacteria bacterium]